MPRSSYQNTASRLSVPPDAEHETLADESSAVQRLPSRKEAPNRRPSLASSFPLLPPVFPLWGCVSGLACNAVAIGISEETVGVIVPGLLTRSKSNSPNDAPSMPMK
jgi:hypothetical protein